MKNKRPILSICIPTYNRADVLQLCIQSIISSIYYNDDEIEIVISDNCSTDNTKDVINDYKNKYSNIIYHKNEVNIGGEKNFIKCLELGTGKFLKLHNDYSIFNEEGLGHMLNLIKENQKDMPIILFASTDIENRQIRTRSLDEVVVSLGWSLSWIGLYGFWNEDFKKIEDKEYKIESQFLQIYWFLNIFQMKKDVLVSFYNYSKRYNFQSVQGGYNFIKVHLINFGKIFKELVNLRELSQETFNILRRKQLHSMLKWYYVLKIKKDPKYSYSVDNGLFYIWSEYKYYLWFYYDSIKYLIMVLYEKLHKSNKL